MLNVSGLGKRNGLLGKVLVIRVYAVACENCSCSSIVTRFYWSRSAWGYFSHLHLGKVGAGLVRAVLHPDRIVLLSAIQKTPEDADVIVLGMKTYIVFRVKPTIYRFLINIYYITADSTGKTR